MAFKDKVELVVLFFDETGVKDNHYSLYYLCGGECKTKHSSSYTVHLKYHYKYNATWTNTKSCKWGNLPFFLLDAGESLSLIIIVKINIMIFFLNKK